MIDDLGNERINRKSHSVGSQLANSLSHSLRLGPVGMMRQKILQRIRCSDWVTSADVNLGQDQLGVGKVRRIDSAGLLQMFDREVELAQQEISHAQLRVRKRVVG